MSEASNVVARELRRHLDGVVLKAFESGKFSDIHVDEGGRVFASSSAGRTALGEIGDSAVRKAMAVLADVRGVELDAEPLFGGELPRCEPFYGARFQAVLPPVARSPVFSFRVHSREVFPLEAFQGGGDGDLLEALWHAVSQRETVVVFGGTGMGKSSLLNSLLAELASAMPSERVLVVEDTPELRVTHADQVAMCTDGEIDLHELVRTCLRMQPDRVVVGEVRGPEALDLVDLFTTGHEGGLATVHASSGVEALARLEHLASRHPSQRVDRGLRKYVVQAIGVVVGMRRGEHPYVGSVERVGLDENGEFMTTAYERAEKG